VDISRRELIQSAVASGVFLAASSLLRAEENAAPPTTAPAPAPSRGMTWIDSKPHAPGAECGVTWGVPWPRGQVQADQTLAVAADGKGVPAQTWPLAYWPDKSVKWTAVAIGPDAAKAEAFEVMPGKPTAGQKAVRATSTDDAIEVDTGTIACTLAKAGDVLIRSMRRGGKTIGSNGRLVALRQDASGDALTTNRDSFGGKISAAVIQQDGPVRAVVKFTGVHHDTARQWLPFVVRLYFYAGSDVIRVVHSFVWDGDESKDFLAGLGLKFDVAMRDEFYNRHVRLVGQEHGLFAEAVRPITGLRRDPGDEARQAQIDGKATSADSWATSVSRNIQRVPAWGDFTLTQLSADGFQIRKRTKPGCGWIAAGAGRRAAGVGYVGGATGGGVSFGIRDFWQKHPAQIDIRNAASDTATVTLWLYSPEAPPMDLRMYHDVMGMDTYDQQNEGLAITYEDYEPGYGTPYGIARTSELTLKIEPATPSREAQVAFADIVRTPPLVMAPPERILASGVLGAQWTLPDRSTPTRAWIEEKLSRTLDYYIGQIDQQSWYGFWDYGDVMHSHDDDRHVWRYDIGGYAWDNSELSTDLWLWLSVLRTGRADVYRMAEAMGRHTGEVDVYHIGRFRGLGTRHGVQHWADSSKQSRISTPLYRRFYYYLTADERTGDLLEEQMHTIEAEKKIVVGRKLKPGSPTLPLPSIEDPAPGGEVDLGGLNWGNAIAAWIIKAERTGDPQWHEKIVKAMRGVGELPKGFYTDGWTMNIETGEVRDRGNPDISLSHLMACFGLPEIANELVSLYGDKAPKFTAAWAQYGRLYNGTDEQRRKELGDFKPGLFKEASLKDTHSRCTAFAARHGNDPQLAERAWTELLGKTFTPQDPQNAVTHVSGPASLNPVEEMAHTGTNGAAQWGLAAMECLALVGDALKK